MEHGFKVRFLLAALAVVFWVIQKIASAARKETGPHGTPRVTAAQAEAQRRAPAARAAAARAPAERQIRMMPAPRPAPPAPPPAAVEASPPSYLAPTPRPDYAAALPALPPGPPSLPTLVEAAEAARPGGGLLAELRQPATARRAILLQEILGAPVGLR